VHEEQSKSRQTQVKEEELVGGFLKFALTGALAI